MAGICGWQGWDTVPEQREPLLRMMARGLALNPNAPTTAWHAPAAALATRAQATSLHHTATLSVAVIGTPWWRAASATAQAREYGAAAAFADLYTIRGRAALDIIAGPFALAVIDHAAQRVLLAIDRIGIHSLCYARPRSGGLVFGSTVDAVTDHPSVGRQLDDQAIFNYLYQHIVPAPGCIYRDVQKLLPGQCLELHHGILHLDFYWALHYQDVASASIDALKPGFDVALRTAVQRAGTGPEVGAFLSGGTDSSTVTGILTELRGGPVDSYSMGFQAEGFDEIEYARITARHYGCRTHEYYVTPQDVAEAVPLIARAYDEPFGNASAVPTYFCAKLGQMHGSTTLLAGDGGDEIFGGNTRYAKQKIFEAYFNIPAFLRNAMIEPFAFKFPGAQTLPPLRKLQSYIAQAHIPLPDRMETYSFLHRTPLREIFTAEYLARIDADQPLALMREVYQRTDSHAFLNRMLHLDMKQTLADNDLRKVNKMCDLAGIAVRYPLLDEDLVEFAATLPPLLKVKGVKLRYFFKEALRDFLPPATLSKHKHGFGLPFGLWLNEAPALRELAHDSLHAFQKRGYFQPGYADRLLEQHRQGHASYYGVMIWVIMMLEQWLNKHGH